MRGRPWTVKEEEKLIELYINTSITCKQIASELDRSLSSVDHRIRQLRKKGMVGYRKPEVQRKYKKDLSNVKLLTPEGAYFITSVLFMRLFFPAKSPETLCLHNCPSGNA